MKVVFNDGTLLDTSDTQSIEAFKQSHHTFISGIQDLHHQTTSNQALTERIRHKYRLKNTTGYAINALVDYHDPIEIIEHLMVGSEGTLGFIAEVTYNTVVEHSNKASSLLVFADIETSEPSGHRFIQNARCCCGTDGWTRTEIRRQ